MRLPVHSLRARLQLWYTVILCIVVGLLMTRFYILKEQELLRAVQYNLQKIKTEALPGMTRYLATKLRFGPPGPDMGMRTPDSPHNRSDWAPSRSDPLRPPPPGGRPEFQPRPLEQLAAEEDIYLVLWSRDANLFFVHGIESPPIPVNAGRFPIAPDEIFRENKDYYELLIGAPHGNAFAIGQSLTPVRAELAAYRWKLVGAGLLIVAAASGVGWLIASWLLAPLHEISVVARRIADGQRTEVVKPARATVEVEDLTNALNLSYRRLNELIEQQIQFSADASHELRTPVAAILSLTDLALKNERTVGDYQQTLRKNQSAAERMRDLINNLLELSRFNRGEFDFKRNFCTLTTLVEGCIDWLGSLVEEKGIKLTLAIDDVSVLADARRIEQVLINLLSNAIRHTPDGGSITLSTCPDSKSGFVRVEVLDNGVGISKDDLPHLFDRFYRADKARQSKQQGYGLGLAICAAIIEAHGGEIGAESELGKDSKFWFTLPVR